jgi:hypothetical protein
MRLISVALLAIAVIAAPSFSQCSTLTVAGTINPGETVTVSVSGATPDSLTFIAIGDPGSTTIPFPGGGLVLGLESPFLLLPLGVTDASGDVSQSATVSLNIPAGVIQDYTFTVQAVTVSFGTSWPPTFSFCVSNTATLVSGTG